MNLHVGSILDVQADAVVNPANSFMWHGGGLAKVIDSAASSYLKGYRLNNDGSPSPSQARCEASLARAVEYARHRDSAPLIATGDALAGPGGNSGFKHIIHTVGPIWGGGQFCEPDLLEVAMESACEVAIQVGAKSLAIPAISCGIFGYPVADAARILVNVAAWYDCAPGGALDITFALMSDEHESAFRVQMDRPLFVGVSR